MVAASMKLIAGCSYDRSAPSFLKREMDHYNLQVNHRTTRPKTDEPFGISSYCTHTPPVRKRPISQTSSGRNRCCRSNSCRRSPGLSGGGERVSASEAGAKIRRRWLRLGLDLEDDFHHSAVVALTGRAEAYHSDYLGDAQEFLSADSSGRTGIYFCGFWASTAASLSKTFRQPHLRQPICSARPHMLPKR
jgi:hypothetical protein